MMRHRTAASVLLAVVMVATSVLPASGVDPATPTIAWGAYAAVRTGQTQQSAVTSLQGNVGRELAVSREFLLWDQAFPSAYHTWLRDTGHSLVVSVKAKRANGTRIPWASIATAAPGSALYSDMVRWADRMRDFGAPIYFAFNHEPEEASNQANGTDGDFIAAWRKFVTIFRQEGAANVKFVWIMTDFSFSVAASDRRAAARWYPGDDYVDALGADAYNWYTCRPGIKTAWHSLATIIEGFRQFGRAHPSKELWLTEWASTEDPAQPGRKAAWLQEATELFKQPGYEQFKGLSYFNSGHDSGTYVACKWWVDSSESSLRAFSAMGADVYWTATVDGEPSPPPAPSGKSVLMVVGSTSVVPDEAALISRLGVLGYDVTVTDDSLASADAVDGEDLVLISQSVDVGVVGTKFRDLPIPVVIWKPWLYDDMGMTAPAALGTLSGSPYAVIVDSAHPLAAGLSGTVQLLSPAATLPWGEPLPSADVVATVAGKAVLFAYPAGAQLSGLTAPACRIAVPAYKGAVTNFTPSGWAIFDAAIAWADGGC